MTERKIRCVDGRKKGWFLIDDDFVDKMAKLCGWQGALIYNSLCRHIEKIDQSCFPSISLMAEELGVNRKTVLKGIKVLEDRNVIEVKKTRKKNGVWLNNCYHLQDKSVWDYTPIPPKSKGDSVQEGLPQDDHVPVGDYPCPSHTLPLVPERDTKGTHKREHIKGNTSCVPDGTSQLASSDLPVQPSHSCPASPTIPPPLPIELPPSYRAEDLERLLEKSSAPRRTTPKSPQGVDCSPEENKALCRIIEEFRKHNPAVRFDFKSTRAAALDMFRVFGLEECFHFIDYAFAAPQMDKYCPIVTTPEEYMRKIGALKANYAKNKTEYDQKQEAQKRYEQRIVEREEADRKEKERFALLAEEQRQRRKQQEKEDSDLGDPRL